MTFEPIEVLFKHAAGQPDPDWPERIDDNDATSVDESEEGAVRYFGVIYGASVGVQFGLNLAFDTDWSDLETGYAIWKPEDFAGPFRTKGVDWGYLDLSIPLLRDRLRANLGWELPRTCGTYGYSVFDDIDDNGNVRHAWSISRSMTNNTGLYVDLSYAELYGHICLGVDMMNPSTWTSCVNAAAAAIKPQTLPAPPPPLGDGDQPGFETGRSELTANGEDRLRAFATENLPTLMAPNVYLRVEGHASPVGTPRFNDAVSYHRARNIVRYLRSYLGITFNVWPGHIIVVAYGEYEANRLGATGDDPAWRRVDVFLDQDNLLRMATGASS